MVPVAIVRTRRHVAAGLWMVGVAAILAGAALAHGAEGRKQASDVELNEQARRRIDAADATFRKSLKASLQSQNVFERRMALERLGKLPHLMNDEVIGALVPLLEDTKPLSPEWCLSAMETGGGGPDGRDQGAEIAYAMCKSTPSVSNGTLAAGLLVNRGAFPRIVAHVSRRPRFADAVVSSLGPSGRGRAATVLETLAASNDPDVQAGLLRLAIDSTCDRESAPVVLDSVIALIGSPHVRVRRFASVTVLRLGPCSASSAQFVEASKRAASVLEAGLQDAADPDIVSQVRLLGPTVEAVLPGVLARFERKVADPSEGPALLAIIAGSGPRGGAATPVLVRVLRDRQRPDLWPPAVRALAAIGPAASSAAPAIIEISPGAWAFLPDFMDALSRIGARPDRGQLARIEAAYREACGPEGLMRSVRNGAYCAAGFRGLSELAKQGGHSVPSP